jgi:hypothetical protein
MAGTAGAGPAGNFCLARGRWTRWGTDCRESSPEWSDRRAGVAARPGWERVSPGSMLAGHLPDERPRLAPTGLKLEPRSPRAVSQLLWSHKDCEGWFSLGEHHEELFRFGPYQLRNRRACTSALTRYFFTKPGVRNRRRAFFLNSSQANRHRSGCCGFLRAKGFLPRLIQG